VTKDQNEECPVAAALDIIGERWTLLVVRDLLRLGARRFQDLELSLAGVSPNTLSARLKRLEEAGIVERRFYEEHPPRAEYVLTEKGRALGPIVLALKKWGEKYEISQR
jgi:DNA-binding HxlR family transcriptional regulator